MGFQQKTWKKAPFGVGYIFFQWNFEVMVATIWTKNMFRKIIWANFVGYNSTRHYIIHNTVYFVQSLTIEQKTPTFCCWSMLRTTLECFFFLNFEISLESFLCPYIFAEYQVAPKSSAISCWPGWHESHDRRVHELEDHWLLGPQQNIQSAVNFRVECGVVFEGWGWKSIGNPKCSTVLGDGKSYLFFRW